MNQPIEGKCLLCGAKKLTLHVWTDGAETVKCQACKSTWRHREPHVALVGAGLGEKDATQENSRKRPHRNPQDERKERCGYEHLY